MDPATHDAADLDDALAVIDAWGAGHAAAAVIAPDGAVAARGDRARTFRWASVTKPVTALAVMVGVGRGLLSLDEPAGPPGATVRHLLAHTSGLPFEGTTTLAAPGARRIYSNPGFDELGRIVADRAGTTFGGALADLVFEPLGVAGTRLLERPSQGLHGPLDDLARIGQEFLRPTLLDPGAAATMRSVAFPGRPGVVPGVGNYAHCDWGLGVEIRGDKRPHWTSGANSPATFGHIGGSGGFLWVDPVADLAVACLTDRDYGPWALAAWPVFSAGILAAAADATDAETAG
jgi:CubicO group peptidase (beta-lactamase class C family)